MRPIKAPKGAGRAGRGVAVRASMRDGVRWGVGRDLSAAGVAVAGCSQPVAPPFGMSAAKLAKFEALEDAAEVAELAQLLQTYTVPTRAARFAATTRAERAGNVRTCELLDRLSFYPQLKQARAAAPL